jgi:hypothetical protein
MHQQLWGYKVEWKSVSRGTGGKKVEYHWAKEYIDHPSKTNTSDCVVFIADRNRLEVGHTFNVTVYYSSLFYYPTEEK